MRGYTRGPLLPLCAPTYECIKQTKPKCVLNQDSFQIYRTVFTSSTATTDRRLQRLFRPPDLPRLQQQQLRHRIPITSDLSSPCSHLHCSSTSLSTPCSSLSTPCSRLPRPRSLLPTRSHLHLNSGSRSPGSPVQTGLGLNPDPLPIYSAALSPRGIFAGLRCFR